MLRFSAHQRRVTALTLLVMFLNVFVGQAYCAGMSIAPPAHSHAPGTPKHQHGATAHSHATGPAEHQHSKDSAAHINKAADKRAADYCSDDAAAVMASLAHPTKFSLANPVVTWLALVPATGVLLPRFTHYDRTQAVTLVRPEHLKPKIPDIRIFTGSLTI